MSLTIAESFLYRVIDISHYLQKANDIFIAII